MDGKRGVRWVNVYVRTREGNLSDRSKLRQSRCWNTDERHVNQSCWSWSYSVGNSTFTKHMISNNRHDAFIFCSVAICLAACLDYNFGDIRRFLLFNQENDQRKIKKHGKIFSVFMT